MPAIYMYVHVCICTALLCMYCEEYVIWVYIIIHVQSDRLRRMKGISYPLEEEEEGEEGVGGHASADQIIKYI